MALLLKLIPAPAIRFFGRLQFRYPFLRPLIHRIGQSLVGRGVIQRGPGKGLKFNARGANPGYLTGTTVPEEQDLVARLSTPGAVVYDLGANVGFYAVIAASLVGPQGTVCAFEPTPQLCARIRENAVSNGLTNLNVIESAVCDIDGHVSFGVVGELSVSNSMTQATSATEVQVRSLTLDTFAKTARPPDVMLIDIEGAEVAALRGGLTTIAAYRPVILIEVHWLGEAFHQFFEASLAPLGYTATTYAGEPLPTGDVRYHALLRPAGTQ